MSLINCPECGREISDKATSCIHCGFPLNGSSTESKNENAEICLIYGVEYDLSDFKRRVLADTNEEFRKVLCSELGERIGSSGAGITALVLYSEIKKTGKVPKEIPLRQRNLDHYISNIRCPKCGSPYVATGARGVNGFWGFIGASKTVNRCQKCGHTWKPRR